MCLTLSRPGETRDARLGLWKESTSPELPLFPAAHRGILKCSGVAANPYALFWGQSPKSCIASAYEGTGLKVWGVRVQSRKTEICTRFLCNFTSILQWSLSSYISGGSSCFCGICLEKGDAVHCNEQGRAHDLDLLCIISLPWQCVAGTWHIETESPLLLSLLTNMWEISRNTPCYDER